MRDRYEQKRSGIKRIWLLTVLVMLILVSAWGTLAAYVSRSYVKGVATTPKQGFSLSSDYLSAVSRNAPYPDRKILLTEKAETDNSPYTFTFSITNSADGSVSTRQMQYFLKMSGLPTGATVSDTTGDITADVLTGYTAPVMNAYTRVTHTYTITIPKDKMASAADIIVTATPNADSDTSGFILAGRLQPSILGTVAAFSYKGTILENPQKNPSIKINDYAAFNYQISISNAGEGKKMVLTWDNNLVEIDPLFLNMIREKSDSNDTTPNPGTLTIKMDDTNSSYLIQFYRLGPDISGWDALGLKFEEDKSQREGNQE